MTESPYHTDTGVGLLPREPKPCNFHPPHVRDALVAASQTPITRTQPLARIVAIDKAVDYSRRLHPELFHKEN